MVAAAGSLTLANSSRLADIGRILGQFRYNLCMARPIGYTRSRYYIMQGMMWLILAGGRSVSRCSPAGQIIERCHAGDRRYLQTVSVRLPAKWKFSIAVASCAIFVAETANGATSRFITVEEHEAGFFERIFCRGDSDQNSDRRRNKSEKIPMGPITGVDISTKRNPSRSTVRSLRWAPIIA